MFTDKMRRAILDGKYEETELGLFVPSERTLVQGIVSYGYRGGEQEVTHNRIVTQGLTYTLATALGDVPAINNWYVAVFSGDVQVQASWTAANFASTATEVQAYASATRPQWSRPAVSGGQTNSFNTKAEFKATQNGVVIRGAALISSATKGGAGGTLMGATRFNNPKPLDEDEILDVGYGLQLTAVV